MKTNLNSKYSGNTIFWRFNNESGFLRCSAVRDVLSNEILVLDVDGSLQWVLFSEIVIFHYY